MKATGYAKLVALTSDSFAQLPVIEP